MEAKDVQRVQVDFLGVIGFIDIPLTDALRAAAADAYNRSRPLTPVATPPPAPTPVVVPVSTPLPIPIASPVPPVTAPAVTRRTSPPIEVDHSTVPVTIKDVQVVGGDMNIVVQNAPAATIDNVVSARAFRADSTKSFKGQGFYTTKISPGIVRVSNVMSRDNGWQRGRDISDLTMFRHAFYGDFGCNYEIRDSIFAGGANAGAQTRGSLLCERCVFLDCANAVLLVMSGAVLRDCLIYDGHYLPEKDAHGGRTWTANSAINTGTHTELDNVWIVGRPSQGLGLATLLDPHGPMKFYPQGAVVGNKNWDGGTNHPEYVHEEASFNVKNSVIAGWPGAAFGGDKPHSGAGFRVLPSSASVEYDYVPVLAAVEAGRITPADAAAQIQYNVRRLVKWT